MPRTLESEKSHVIQRTWEAGTTVANSSLNSRNDVAFSVTVTVNYFITGQRRPP